SRGRRLRRGGWSPLLRSCLDCHFGWTSAILLPACSCQRLHFLAYVVEGIFSGQSILSDACPQLFERRNLVFPVELQGSGQTLTVDRRQFTRLSPGKWAIGNCKGSGVDHRAHVGLRRQDADADTWLLHHL